MSKGALAAESLRVLVIGRDSAYHIGGFMLLQSPDDRPAASRFARREVASTTTATARNPLFAQNSSGSRKATNCSAAALEMLGVCVSFTHVS